METMMKNFFVLLSLTTSFSVVASDIIDQSDYQKLALQAEVASVIKNSELSCTQTGGMNSGLSKQEFSYLVKDITIDTLERKLGVSFVVHPKDGEGYIYYTYGKNNSSPTQTLYNITIPFINTSMSYNGFTLTISKIKKDYDADFVAQCNFL